MNTFYFIFGINYIHYTLLLLLGSVLDLIGGGPQQNVSRSGTPAGGHRKSPTADQGTQVKLKLVY